MEKIIKEGKEVDVILDEILSESNLTKEDWKERYEILKKYQAFLKAQREKK